MKFLALGIIVLLSYTATSQKIAIKNANIVTMTAESVNFNQTVLIHDGVIISIQPGSSKVDGNYEVIDAKGKFLIPALMDMHMHLISDDRISETYAEDELKVPVTYGVMRARIPIGASRHLDFKRKAEKGELFCPQLHVAGHIYGNAFSPNTLGIEVKSADAARVAVRKLKSDGYEFIKLTFGISQELFYAVINESRKVDITVFGHYPESIDVRETMRAGMHNEHMDQFIEGLIPDSLRVKSVSGLGVMRAKDNLLETIESNTIDELAALTKESGVWVTPTQSFFIKSFVKGFSKEEFETMPEYQFVSSTVRNELLSGWYWRNPPGQERRMNFKHIRSQLITSLNKHDVGIMAGSDSPEGVRLYGIGLHYELQALRDAGLSNFESLKTATVNPAKFLGIETRCGTIEVGKGADMILLDGNPLDDIDNTLRIEGICYVGKWYGKRALLGIRKKAAEKVSKAVLRDNIR